MTRPALTVPLALAASAVLLQGCLAASIAGDVAEGAVNATGAVASAIIPGESRKQRLERLDREDKARRKAERKAEKERRRREDRD